MKYGKYPKMM